MDQFTLEKLKKAAKILDKAAVPKVNRMFYDLRTGEMKYGPTYEMPKVVVVKKKKPKKPKY